MKTRHILGWSLYDLANTAFSALFITFFFPLWVKVYLGGNEFHIGLVFGIALVLSGIFVPMIGALADAWGRKIPTLLLFTILCTFSTFFVGFSNLPWAIGLAVAATFFYHAALDLYDALIMEISTEKTRGLISGIGVALGYVGAILAIVMAYIIMSAAGWDSRAGVVAIFPATALFFLFFAGISFGLMKEKKRKPMRLGQGLSKAFKEIKTTITKIRKFKKLFLFLLASFLYTDGMNIAIIFFYLFAREQIGVGMQAFFFIFAANALAAGIGALLVGKVTDRVGPKKTLVLGQLVWMATIVILMFADSITTFIIGAALGSLALGGVWTATRPMLIKLAPKHKVAELLGFQGLTEKFSGGIGPVLFGGAVVLWGYRTALFIPLSFFILALIILRYVDGK